MKLLGIDIGSAYLKCLLLERGRDGSCSVLAQDSVQLCPDPLRPQQEHKLQIISAFMLSFLATNNLKTCRAVVSLSGFHTHTRVLQLPPFDVNKLGGFLEAEAETICPHGSEGMLYNYGVLCDDPAEPRGVICLTREEDLTDDLQALTAAGVEPVKVLLGPLSVAQADFCADIECVHALVDIGAKSTRITVRDGSTLINIFQIPLGMAEPIRNFSKQFRCSMQEAQTALDYWLNLDVEDKAEEYSEAEWYEDDPEEIDSVVQNSQPQDIPEEAYSAEMNNDESEPALDDELLVIDDEIDAFFSDSPSPTTIINHDQSSAVEKTVNQEKFLSNEPALDVNADNPEQPPEDFHQDEEELFELEPEDYAEAEAPDDKPEPVISLDISDREIGGDQPDGSPVIEDDPVYVNKELLVHAQEYFPDAISRLLTTVYRTLFRLRKESGIDPQALALYFYGYLGGSRQFIKHARGQLQAETVASCKIPDEVLPQNAVSYALACAAEHSHSSEPDMLPRLFIRRRLKNSLLQIKAAIILLSLLPLPLLFGSILYMTQSSDRLNAVQQEIAEMQTGMEEEKQLEQQMQQAKSSSAQIMSLHKNRERFFSLLPAFSSIAQSNVWIGSFKIEDTSDGAGGGCQLQAWSYNDMDSFMQRLQGSGVVKECSLLKASDGDKLQKGELTVGEIEGTKKGTAYVTGDLTYLLSGGEVFR